MIEWPEFLFLMSKNARELGTFENAGKGHIMVMNRKGNAFKTTPQIP